MDVIGLQEDIKILKAFKAAELEIFRGRSETPADAVSAIARYAMHLATELQLRDSVLNALGGKKNDELRAWNGFDRAAEFRVLKEMRDYLVEKTITKPDPTAEWSGPARAAFSDLLLVTQLIP